MKFSANFFPSLVSILKIYIPLLKFETSMELKSEVILPIVFPFVSIICIALIFKCSIFDIVKYLNDADIVILPSNYESFFITVYESLLFNKVVITDDVADIKSNLNKFNNVKIINSKEPTLYEKTIEDVFLNFNTYIKDTKEASNFIKNSFTWNSIYNKIKLK